MRFKAAEERLLTIFCENDFTESLRRKQLHTAQIPVVKCGNGTVISVSFPGYKARIKNDGKVIYDYRVDMIKNGEKTALSHSNLVTDIYNKITAGEMPPAALHDVLTEIGREGGIYLKKIKEKLNYKSVPPSDTLKHRVRKAHDSKFYNRAGNTYDLTIEELLKSIKWIVIQEDINYPMPKYEGRKMSFARYAEAVFVTQNDTHTLEEVIKRTLSHTRPQRWREMNYDFLAKISC